MYYLWTIGIICCFSVTLTIGTHLSYECKTGVECLTLEKCTGLYRQWQEEENKKEIEDEIIRWIRCGPTDTIDQFTKVCCPAAVYLSNNTPPFKPYITEKRIMTTEKSTLPIIVKPNRTTIKPIMTTENLTITTIKSNITTIKPIMTTENLTITTIKPNITTIKPIMTTENLTITTIKPNITIIKPTTNPKNFNITCGINNDDRIYGGEPMQIDDFPWMALLAYTNGNKTEYYCGGVLISSRYILTAAHCINSSSLKDWDLTHIRLGEWNLSSNPDYFSDISNNVTDVSIEKAIVHESFKPDDVNFHNDIALVRLSQEVEFTDFVRPICLPTGIDLLKNTFEGYSLYVAGWGKTQNSSSSEVKLKVSLPVVNQTECVGKYKDQTRNVTSMQLCAGGAEGKDSCKGDSGGSLMGQMSGKWTAIGVVSYGPNPCGTQRWPGVYTRVTSYIEWIQSHMKP